MKKKKAEQGRKVGPSFQGNSREFYLFFSRTNPADALGWNKLFKATEVAI